MGTGDRQEPGHPTAEERAPWPPGSVLVMGANPVTLEQTAETKNEMTRYRFISLYSPFPYVTEQPLLRPDTGLSLT